MAAESPGTLGQVLRRRREELGLTLYQLSARTGINRSNLHRLENAVITQPSVETLNRLAHALELEPEDLYDAYWTRGAGPLPSLGTYFRSKYRLSETQIAALNATFDQITEHPSTRSNHNKKKGGQA